MQIRTLSCWRRTKFVCKPLLTYTDTMTGHVLLAFATALCFSRVTATSNGSISILVPQNFRLEPTHNGSCLNFLWQACNPATKCIVGIEWKKERVTAPPSAVITMKDYHPVVTPGNYYTFCAYDSAKVNESCCKYPGGRPEGFAFGTYEYISFKIKHCANMSRGNCAAKSNWERYVMPDKNPCLVNHPSTPCKNGASCTTQVANEYNCTCASGWTGKTCETAAPTNGPTAAASQLTSFVSLLLVLVAALKFM